MSSISRIAWVLVAAGGIAACERESGTVSQSTSSPAQPAGRIMAPMDAAAQTISADRIRGVIAEISDDRYGGRLPATEGDTLARRYLAAELAKVGFAPGAAGGSYEQPVELVGVTAQAPPTWSFNRAGSAVELARSTDFVAASGLQAEKAEIRDAELVFAGYAIQAPEYNWDDFKDVDVRGKVLVVLNNDPDWDAALFEGPTRLYYGRWMYKYESGARHGAAGVIIIHTTPSAGYPWQVVQTSWGGVQFELPAEGEPRIQLKGWATEDAARRLLKAGGADLDALVKQAKSRGFKPVPLNLRTSIEFGNEVSRVRTANVAGLLPGSDPKLKDEVVIYSAHHDHFGIGEPDKTGDKIYNGAEDNAAGCAQVLAIARAMAALPEKPRRSVLFLFVAGEEQGLLGSRYYSVHPTFAPGRIAANINYDGGNFLGRTRDLTQVGAGKSSLDALAGALVAKQGRKLVPDQNPDKGYYYRSDQFSFAKIGVPALYFDEGTDYIGKPAGWGKQKHDEWTEHVYHQPSDQLTPEWVFDGMIEDAMIGFEAGWLIAQADEMPAWNKGDEF